VEGGKLSSTATLAQGKQDCTLVNVSGSTTPSRNIMKTVHGRKNSEDVKSKVKVPILFVFIQLLLK
jgi:hypothetical protein